MVKISFPNWYEVFDPIFYDSECVGEVMRGHLGWLILGHGASIGGPNNENSYFFRATSCPLFLLSLSLMLHSKIFSPDSLELKSTPPDLSTDYVKVRKNNFICNLYLFQGILLERTQTSARGWKFYRFKTLCLLSLYFGFSFGYFISLQNELAKPKVL